jgi:ATP-binding cassette subfamily C protein CydD
MKQIECVEEGAGAQIPARSPVSAPARATAIGEPSAAERRGLSRSGRLLAAADLLWIPQAGLIAFVLGILLTALHSGADLGTLDSIPLMPVAGAFAGFAGLAVLRVALQKTSANLARRAARSLQSRARRDLLQAAAQSSPAAPFPASGTFAAHVTEQVDHLGPYFRHFVPQKERLKLVPLGIVAATAWHSWLAALILVFCGPLIPVFMALVGMRAKAASAEQQEELTRLSGFLLDRIRGLETLELFGALRRTGDDIAQAGDRFRKGTMRVLRIAFLSSTVLELFSALGIAFIAVYVGFSLLGEISAGTWGEPLGYASGLFVLLLAPEFFAPLRAYAAAYHDRAGGLAAQEKLSRLLPPERPEPATPAGEGVKPDAPALTSPPAIAIASATLVLGDRTVFRGFDLDIAPGETVFLNGPSGSGKTSCLDMIMGFHAPQAGTVTVAGLSPEQHGRGFLQDVSWLGQAPRLFHGSLRANLLKGVRDPGNVTDEDIRQALDLAGALALVERLPQGLSTRLGEDGFGLSAGEIRRIALARAALRTHSKILLADEPTAGLDEETAANVVEGLKKLAAGRTTVVATHDPALLRMPGRSVDVSRLAILGGRST